MVLHGVFVVLSFVIQIFNRQFQHRVHEPLLIREHARKYQYIVSHALLWRRIR